MRKSFFRKNKKGVSPLIATVLLIAFAVALGAIVMSWGRSYIVQTQSSVQKKGSTDLICSSDVRLEALKSPDGTVYEVCTNGSSIIYTMQNVGQKNIANVLVQVIDKGGASSNSSLLNISLSPGQFHTGHISYTAPLKVFSVTPIVVVGSVNTTCTKSGFTMLGSDIGECS